MSEFADLGFDMLRRQMLDDLAAQGREFARRLGRDHFSAPVMAAMAQVARHQHVPYAVRNLAYGATPLPLGFGKTASEPLIVALLSDLLDVQEHHRVLEIGSGFGYHTAVLAKLCAQVFSVEIVPTLAAQADARLAAADVKNVTFGIGDGRYGWSVEAPFDRILVTAAPEIIPQTLLAQLAPGGKMVVPAGLPGAQVLLVVEKDHAGHLRSREVLPVKFAALLRADDSTDLLEQAE